MEEKEQKSQEQPGETTNIPGEPEAQERDLAAQLQELGRQAAQYKDLFLRKAAEFENFRRRTEAELSSMVRFANEELILAILPVMDDLERSLKNATDSDRESPFYKGIELIYQKMQRILESQGVKPFETVGKEFDVQYHDALLQVPKEGVPPHTVIEEVEKGYRFHDKILRHAKVIVSASTDTASQEVGAGEGSDAGESKD